MGGQNFNLGTTQEAADKYDEATSSLKLYLLTNPKETDAREAQKKTRLKKQRIPG
jgi:hypothetical protein